ncbi:MAG: sulfatase [Planctomycetota bacterium]|nr:sulfatase [Planctomycetota bacterium]
MKTFFPAFVLLSVLLTNASADVRPNILFAISDDQSWKHCGAYADPAIQTPAFDRIAREGVLFTRAFCASPSCAPSRAALLTGRHIWELEEGGILFGILKAKFRPFTLDLQDAGYQLGATGKTWGPGVTQGFSLSSKNAYDANSTQSIFGKAFSDQKLNTTIRGINSLDYASNFEQFLSERDPNKPFFFWYGSTEPHQNYEVGRWKKEGKKLTDAILPGFIPDHKTTRGEFLDYALEIEHFDQHLLRMLISLEKRGLLENTIVIVTSDHGNPMPRSKCNLYDWGTRVPLAIRFPAKIKRGRKIDDFVSLVDLGSTILNATGQSTPTAMSGKSLWPMLLSGKSGKIEDRDFAVTAFERHIICRQDGVGYPMRSIRTEQFAYIRNYQPSRWPAGDPDFMSSHQGFYGDCDRGESKRYILENSQTYPGNAYYRLCFGRRPGEELYDMQQDPHQLTNLAADPAYKTIKNGLITQMVKFLKQTHDPRQVGKTPWDDYPFSDQRIFKNPNWKTEGFPMKLPRKN